MFSFVFHTTKSKAYIAPFESILIRLACTHKLQFAIQFEKKIPASKYSFIVCGVQQAILDFSDAISRELPLSLYFVFDTGASDVSLSSVEATFMMKNGYLKSSDVIGKQNYMMANGEISAGTVINLRNVNFGGLDLDNIRASVVHNQTAPLLLGQSILSRLGSIEIDNAKRVLRITYKKKVEECK